MKAYLIAVVAVCGVLAAAVWQQWPDPPEPEDQVHTYRTLQDFDYSLLEGHARGLAMAKARQGFAFHTQHGGTASFQVSCKGVGVMDVQSTPPMMRVRLPADALSRAPDIERLHSHFQGWLGIAPGDVEAAVEPSWVQARILRMRWGVVPDEARCGLGVDVGARGQSPFLRKGI
ncbi:cold-shock protein [Stenotrophomonas sp.]|uniref:cold-shock protein n=1 Tax=Stenotrophomonas sp. TaxID=69392 RepID=UPI002898CC43|nr:cold-shock protein [Stenotrophomonas sp.]